MFDRRRSMVFNPQENQERRDPRKRRKARFLTGRSGPAEKRLCGTDETASARIEGCSKPDRRNHRYAAAARRVAEMCQRILGLET